MPQLDTVQARRVVLEDAIAALAPEEDGLLDHKRGRNSVFVPHLIDSRLQSKTRARQCRPQRLLCKVGQRHVRHLY